MKSVWAAEWLYAPQAWQANMEVHFDETGSLLAVQPRQAETSVLPGCLIPGLVNAHTHSELSHLAGQIPAGCGMVDFARSVMRLRDILPQNIRLDTQTQALHTAWVSGTQLMGDVCNILPETLGQPVGQPDRYLFHEYLGANAEASRFNPALYSEQIRISPCPHAPYSVSDQLAQAIGRYCASWHKPLSIHLAESTAELDYCRQRTGEFDMLFQELNIQLDSCARSPVDFVINNLPPSTPLLAVHLIEARTADLLRLMYQFRQLWVCICPRSSIWIHNKLPDLRNWRKLGLAICIGTDSLASCPDLDLWKDLKLMNMHFPELKSLELIRMATTNGAQALGLENQFGLFNLGTRPGLLHAPNLHPESSLRNVEVYRLV